MAESHRSDSAPAWLAPRGEGWRIKRGPERLCDNAWFAVDAYAAVAPTGAPADYYVQRCKHVATGVVALDADGSIALVGQWRFPFGAYSWELPEGGAPHGEPPLEGAKRELREEAGLVAHDWRHLLTMQLTNASSDEVAWLYLATELTPCDDDPDATEALTVVRVPFQEALAAVVGGHIKDSLTVAALLRVHHMATTGELPEPLALALAISPARPRGAGD